MNPDEQFRYQRNAAMGDEVRATFPKPYAETYRIVRMQRKGIARWAVFQGANEIARFYLKRHVIDWILAQEKK